jgi:hypothetical protein
VFLIYQFQFNSLDFTVEVPFGGVVGSALLLAFVLTGIDIF